MNASRLRLAALGFFLSGGAGLVYQVVWLRVLHQIFGISAHAVTAVLAAYLGGLALGAWLLGPVADRTRSPLRLYAWLELGIAAAAVAGTHAAALLDPIHLRLAAALAPDSTVLLAARVVLAGIVVLPATVLMGATLPAMTRAFCDSIEGVGRGLAGLYALNTAGAVAGSLLAGFVLVRAVGVHGTLWIAVAANTAVAALVFALARGERAAEREPAPEASEPTAERGLLAALALSGFASLYLEVVWTRMLLLVLGSSTYAFVTMLATFLVGIALGSLAARALVDRLRDPRRAFGLLQLAIAASTLATLPLTRTLLLRGTTDWLDAQTSWLDLAALRFGVSFLVMLLPTTLIGATLPLAVRIAATRVGSLGGRVGELYATNTLGNIAGAAVGGFLLLPALGMQRSIAAAAALNLGAALYGKRVRTRALPLLTGIGAALALFATWRPAPLPFTAGTPQDPLLFYEEGLVSTVAVFQQAYDGARRVMSVDGVAIGQSSAGLDRKQQVLAHLPFVLAPAGAVRDVLSIGLGTGILAAEAALHPGVSRVEAVELSPSVVEGARFFAEYNGGIPDASSVRVIVDDGVTYLRRASARYDAIIADGKSRSGHAGNAIFYSQDFYRAAREHLQPRGTFLQWAPLDMAPEEFRTIVRTFVRSFPHSYVWLGGTSCFLLGQDHALEVDVRRVAEALAESAAANLARYGWVKAEESLALLIGDGPGIAPWIATGDEVNSVEHPVLEFFSLVDTVGPVDQRIAANVAALDAIRERGLTDVRIDGANADALARARDAVAALLDGLASSEQPERAELQLMRAAELSAADGVVSRMVAEALFERAYRLEVEGNPDEALERYLRSIALWPRYLEARLNGARLLALQGRTWEAEDQLQAALSAHPLAGAAHRLLGGLLVARGEAARSVDHLRQALSLTTQDADLHEALGVSLMRSGAFADALSEFREALWIRPDAPAVMNQAALLLALAPDPAVRQPDEAVRLARRAVRLKPGDASLLETLGTACAAAGDFEAAVEAQEAALRIELAAGNEARAAATRDVRDRYLRKESPLPVQ